MAYAKHHRREKDAEASRRYRERHQETYRAKQREKQRRYRASMTPEHRERLLVKKREYDRKRRQTPAGQRKNRENRIRWAYGISLEEHAAILDRGCAICGTCEGQLGVDHDHATGAVRDALCTNCNVGLGMFGDEPARLKAAMEYLENHGRGR